jgi:GTP-binding protein
MPSRTVAIVGRPNVGKSALFNRLAGRRISIVHDQPGVTRDRIFSTCKLGNAPFAIVDTGGIGALADPEFTEQVRAEADIAMHASDLIVFVVDAQDGITPVDADLARQLRRTDRPVLLVANKIDHDKHASNAAEFVRLGFPDVLSISAEHGRGIGGLVEAIEERLPAADDETEDAFSKPLAVTIVGRPNVGKSSLINAILEDHRTLVSAVSGTTRDAVDIPYSRDGKNYMLIDTAGIRPRGKVDSSVEVFSVMRSEKSIERADLCVLVIDASMGITSQDKKIAGLIQEAHKPCIVAVNKWDLLKPAPHSGESRRDVLEATLAEMKAELFFLDYAPMLLVSARTNENLGRLFKAMDMVRRDALQKLGTGVLNRVLQELLSANPPPIKTGKRFKILYATQVEQKHSGAIIAPRFLFFVNDPKALPPAYRKYLENQLRLHAPYRGLPMLFSFRGRKTKEENKQR